MLAVAGTLFMWAAAGHAVYLAALPETLRTVVAERNARLWKVHRFHQSARELLLTATCIWSAIADLFMLRCSYAEARDHILSIP